MISDFKCPDTAAMFAGQRVRRFVNIETVAMRKLAMLLKGDRAGQYSIRINDQWRVCFRFEGGNAFEVEIVDYH